MRKPAIRFLNNMLYPAKALGHVLASALLCTVMGLASHAVASDAFPWVPDNELWWHTSPTVTPIIDSSRINSVSHTVVAGEGLCGWVYLPTDSTVNGIELRVQRSGGQWLQAHWGSRAPVGSSKYVGAVPEANGEWHKLVVELANGLSSPILPGDTISAGAWAMFAGEQVTEYSWGLCIVAQNELGPVIEFPGGNPLRIDTSTSLDLSTLYTCRDNADTDCASITVTIDDSALVANAGIPGVYPVTFTAMDSDGNTTIATLSVIVDLPSAGPPLVFGKLNHETWTIQGTGRSIDNLNDDGNFPGNPATVGVLEVSATGLQTGATPAKLGQRLRGYLIPTETGDHQFWLASSDESELWLSTDENPANISEIAQVRSHGAGWTPQYDWDKYGSQDSAVIPLNAGQRYYIEVRHVASGSGRRAEVAWRQPTQTGNPPEDASWVIPGDNLALYEDGAPFIDLKGSATVTQAAGMAYTETATCSDAADGTCTSFDIDYGTMTDLMLPPLGTHTLTYSATDSAGNVASLTRTVEVKNIATGLLSRNLIWAPGNTKRVSDVLNSAKYPNSPDDETTVSVFRSYQGGSNFGQFLRGYLIAPESGEYTFWISSNDSSRLYLSTDANPANKGNGLAAVPGTKATADFEWTKYPEQKSVQVTLVAGQAYFIEAVHKRRWGNGDVAVAWRIPSDTSDPANNSDRLIPGVHLAPYQE